MATRVLFLCTGNSARSIMAEALLRARGGAAYEAHSAGVASNGVHPLTLRALAAAGVEPPRDVRSKHVDEYVGQRFGYVITVCDDATERCPVFPGDVRRIHWSVADPATAHGSEEERYAAFARALRDLDERITAFVRDAATNPRP